MKTVVINNREYVAIEFTQAELEAGAVEQYGEGFDVSGLDSGVTEAMFWKGVAEQLTLDRTEAHPPYGFRMASA